MDFVNFVMALSPILVVLVGILGFKQSAKRVSPIALVWTLILAFTYFNVTGASFADNVKTLDPLVWKGIKEGLKIVLMVFGAFTILNLLRETGAIDDVKSTIARISDDRRVQLIVIGMMLPIFLEGAAGAGAPAAIAAPFLVALGFDPVTSIAVALLGDATPASWGGAGLTTINGGAALVDAGLSTVSLNAAMVGRFHMFGVLIIPFIMVGMVFGKKGFKGAVPYLCFAGVSTCTVMFLLSNFVGAEVTSMGTGLISMLLSLAYVKLVGVRTPEEFRHHAAAQQRKYSAFRAMSPYIYMLVLLPLVRYGFPAVVPNGFAVMCRAAARPCRAPRPSATSPPRRTRRSTRRSRRGTASRRSPLPQSGRPPSAPPPSRRCKGTLPESCRTARRRCAAAAIPAAPAARIPCLRPFPLCRS